MEDDQTEELSDGTLVRGDDHIHILTSRSMLK